MASSFTCSTGPPGERPAGRRARSSARSELRWVPPSRRRIIVGGHAARLHFGNSTPRGWFLASKAARILWVGPPARLCVVLVKVWITAGPSPPPAERSEAAVWRGRGMEAQAAASPGVSAGLAVGGGLWPRAPARRRGFLGWARTPLIGVRPLPQAQRHAAGGGRGPAERSRAGWWAVADRSPPRAWARTLLAAPSSQILARPSGRGPPNPTNPPAHTECPVPTPAALTHARPTAPPPRRYLQSWP